MTAKVAIVEEARESLRFLKDIINGSREFRYVGFCANAQEALVRIPKAKPDLILACLRPSNISELESLIGLRTWLPGLKVLVVSTVVDVEFAREAFRCGANGYVTKSCEPSDVIEAMRLALDGHVLLSDTLVSQMTEAPRPFNASSVTLALLTPHEREIMELLEDGKLYREIADSLQITAGTVGQHLHHIYRKLSVGNKVEALNKAYPRRSKDSQRTAPKLSLLPG